MALDYDIIAVDDDTIEHQIMIRALRKTPYQIKCFENTDEALDFLAAHQARHLFIDYRMPQCNGIEFIEQLTASAPLANTHVYITSNSDVPDAVLSQIQTLGAQFVLKETVSAKDYLANLCAKGSDNGKNSECE